MISAAHVVVYTKDAEADRLFFRDVLGFKSVDAGHGWLIFALPPGEAAFHPSDENGVHELYFICDDLTPRSLRWWRRVSSARTFKKHDGVRLRRCAFPAVARLAFISPNTPWLSTPSKGQGLLEKRHDPDRVLCMWIGHDNRQPSLLDVDQFRRRARAARFIAMMDL